MIENGDIDATAEGMDIAGSEDDLSENEGQDNDGTLLEDSPRRKMGKRMMKLLQRPFSASAN